MPIRTVKGDILKRIEPLFHQCNCVTTYSRGLALKVFTLYSYANVYASRKGTRSKPGTIDVATHTNDSDIPTPARIIINAFAQVYPGPPEHAKDLTEDRHVYFHQCLQAAAVALRQLNESRIVFPWGIGCGLAKGNWEDYEKMLMEFSDDNPHLDVIICG